MKMAVKMQMRVVNTTALILVMDTTALVMKAIHLQLIIITAAVRL